jgi:putative glycosyltransferase (TIGR04372 family)
VIENLPRNFLVIQNVFLCKLLYLFKVNPISAVRTRNVFVWDQRAVESLRYSEESLEENKFIYVPDIDSSIVQELFEKIGLSSSPWYVCLHIREAGYAKLLDDDITEFRNSDINTYIRAVEYITGMGGFVVRMGDESMTPMPDLPGVIDYATSKFKSDENDFILMSYCSYFIGSNSGANWIAIVQQRRILAVNVVPMAVAKIWTSKDLAVPKLHLRTTDDSQLPFREIFDRDIADFQMSYKFENTGVYVVDNSEDEILNAVAEFHDLVMHGGNFSVPQERLQKKFNSLFTVRNFGYYSKTPISPYFLSKHSHLLE